MDRLSINSLHLSRMSGIRSVIKAWTSQFSQTRRTRVSRGACECACAVLAQFAASIKFAQLRRPETRDDEMAATQRHLPLHDARDCHMKHPISCLPALGAKWEFPGIITGHDAIADTLVFRQQPRLAHSFDGPVGLICVIEQDSSSRVSADLPELLLRFREHAATVALGLPDPCPAYARAR